MLIATWPISGTSAPFLGSLGMPRSGVAGGRDHRADRGEVDLVDAAGVLGAGVGRDDLLAELVDRDVGVAGAMRGDPPEHRVVDLHDGAARRALGGHVGERGALVGGQREQAVAAELHHAVERVLALGVGREGCAVGSVIAKGQVFDFLAHPSCLVVEDPKMESLKLICQLAKDAGDKAELVGLDKVYEGFRH